MAPAPNGVVMVMVMVMRGMKTSCQREKMERGRLGVHAKSFDGSNFVLFLPILAVSLFSFLLLCLTSGLFYGWHLFIVIFPIFFILCSNSCMAAFAGQYTVY
jgi:hypothetical protein